MWKIYKFLSSYQYAQTEGKDKSQIKVISREWTLGRLQETVDRRKSTSQVCYLLGNPGQVTQLPELQCLN